MKHSDEFYILAIEDNIPVKVREDFLEEYNYLNFYNGVVSEFFYNNFLSFLDKTRYEFPVQYIVHLLPKYFTLFNATKGYTIISQTLYSDGL